MQSYQAPSYKKFLSVWCVGTAVVLSLFAATVAILVDATLLAGVLCVTLGVCLPTLVWLSRDCYVQQSLGPDPASTAELVVERPPTAPPCVAFALAMVVAVFGLTIGSLFAAPWYALTALGDGVAVDASAGAVPVAAEFSVYAFVPGAAFVDVTRAGFFEVVTKTRRGSIRQSVCVAPVVASPTQAQTAYWAVAYGCCPVAGSFAACESWNSWTVPPNANANASASASSLRAHRALSDDGTVWLDRASLALAVANAVDTSVAAVAANPNGTVALQGSATAPHYFVAISPSPQALRRRLGANALAWMLGVAALWPFVVALALVPFELAAILCSRKMIMLDLWLLALLDKRVDSGRALIELLCPSPEDKYRAAEPHDRVVAADLGNEHEMERRRDPQFGFDADED